MSVIRYYFKKLIIPYFLYQTGLTDCDYYKSSEYEYKNFTELSTLPNVQPTDYLVRIPVYILGARDGNIILSATNTPNRTTDLVYEIGKCRRNRHQSSVIFDNFRF